jgi:hypothetical protein
MVSDLASEGDLRDGGDPPEIARLGSDQVGTRNLTQGAICIPGTARLVGAPGGALAGFPEPACFHPLNGSAIGLAVNATDMRAFLAHIQGCAPARGEIPLMPAFPNGMRNVNSQLHCTGAGREIITGVRDDC